MKLLLCSSDFTDLEIKTKLEELVEKPLKQANVAVINEASAVEFGDKRWLIDGLKLLDETCADIDFVNLLALSLEEVTERLNTADIIFCFGGNTEYLKTVFDKTGFSEILPKFLEKKVWVGSSAGSCVLGNKISSNTFNQIYSDEPSFGVNEYLGIVNLSIVPHLHSFIPDNAIDILKEESKLQDYPVYAISDNCAIVVEDDNIELIGKDGYKIVKGEINHKC